MTKRAHRRGPLAKIALALVLLVVAASLGASLLLRSSDFQQVALARASHWLESRFDVSMAAEGFDLSPLSGRLTLRDLELRNAGGDRLVAVDRIVAKWRPWSLLRGRPHFETIDLHKPFVDFEPIWPARETADVESAPLDSLPFAIDRLSIAGGEVRGKVPESAGAGVRDLVAAVRAEALSAEASFDGRLLEVSHLASRLTLDRPGREVMTLALTVAATGDVGGRFQIEKLAALGPALDLELSTRELSTFDGTAASLRLRADPGEWLPDFQAARPITARGEIDLAAWRGEVELESLDQPAGLLRRWLTPELVQTLELQETELDVTLALALDAEAPEERLVTGTIELSAARDGLVLVEGTIEPSFSLTEALPVEARAEIRVLPAEVGSRRFEAKLASVDARQIEAWRLEDGRLTLDQPSVDRFLKKVSELWPVVVAPATVAKLPRLGHLVGAGTLAGSLEDLDVRASFNLAPHEGSEVRAKLDGKLLGGVLAIETTARGLALDHFVADAAGTVSWSGRIRDPLGVGAVEVEVQGSNIATAGGELLDSVDLKLEGDRAKVAWRLAAALKESGRLTGNGGVAPSLPLRNASGELSWLAQTRSVESVEGSFSLARGVLAAEGRARVAGAGTVHGEVAVPLAALEAVPELEAIAALPLERARGPVVVSWQADEANWRSVLPEPWATRVGHLTASSSGRLELDLERPALSQGTVALGSLAAEIDGRRVASKSDLRLALEEGRVLLEPWSLEGEGLAVEVEAYMDLEPSWRPGDPLPGLVTDHTARLSAAVESTWLESLPLEVIAPGALVVEVQASGPLASAAANARVSAPGLRLVPDSAPAIVVSEPEVEFELEDGALRWRLVDLGVNEAGVTGDGSLLIADPTGQARGTLDIDTGLPVLTSASVPFALADGLLTVTDAQLATSGGEGGLSAAIPVDGRAHGALELGWNLPLNDWAPFLARVLGGEDPEVLAGSFAGTATLPLEHPARGRATAEFAEGRIKMRGRETFLEPSLQLRLTESEVTIEPVELRTLAESFRFEASTALDRDWRLGEPVTELLGQSRIRGTGELEAGLLNPFLEGGRAEGVLGLDLEIAGHPGDLTGRILVDGPQAEVLYRAPYLARLQSPKLSLEVRGGRVLLEEGKLVLNEGPMEITGVVADAGATDLRIELSDAIFRLDYGLLATLGADLRYRASTDAETVLSGSVDVARGALTRSVQLDLDLLSQLLAPIDLSTTEDDPLDLIGLDLEVRTREGVRVKNNLGDLLVRWEPLEVTGTVARPVIEGRLEVDPGGLLHAYGQTVRLDKAVIEYPGQAGIEPRLDFEATTSLEDPTIGRLAVADPFRSGTQQEEPTTATGAAVTADLARYYGEQFAGRLSESVGLNVSLRPLLIFGEADPGARLTVSRDLSTFLAIAASVDLQTAEGRTYLLELHELRRSPSLVAQAFTDDESDYGGALLQRQAFGGGREPVDIDLPRISGFDVAALPGISRRGIKRALGLDKGDTFDPSQRFVAEVELVEYLRRKGFPDARVSVRTVAEPRRQLRVRLAVDIEPGPQVRFEFTGEKIAKPLRGLIQSLYRPDFFEPESIEEMRSETVRALRSQGFLEPKVEISVVPLGVEEPAGDRRVVIETEGGPKMLPEPPVFLGIAAEDADVIQLAFANAVQRVELAVGLDSADRRLLTALADLGYPEARILRRYQSLRERQLTVEIEPGPRQYIESLAIEGPEAGGPPAVAASSFKALTAISTGDPLRRSRLARTAIDLEKELNELGFLEARVRAVLGEASEHDPYAVPVRFAIDAGEVSRLESIEFAGLGSTREKFARRVVGLESGGVLAKADLSKARTDLWRTGLFSGVTAETVDAGSGSKRVVFDLAERDRFRLTYGVRWDSDEGIGAVFDATDDNFLGRGWTLGFRALSSSEEDSLRWLTRVPRAFGGSGSLEFFAAVRELVEVTTPDIFTGQVEVPVDALEGTLQYSHPLTERATFRVYGRYTDTERQLPFFTLRVKNPQLGLQYVYDSRSRDQLSMRGSFASVDLSGSQEFLGGDLRYVRLFSQLGLHRSIGTLFGRRLSWSQSFRLGAADAFGQELIRDTRFFAGGEYSVRGYELESLGELVRFGPIVEPVGGAGLLVANQELRWRLLDDYGLLLFLDAGNVWAELDDFGSDLFTSAGVGVRALTPVGLLRLDIAHALDHRAGVDPEFKIYFGLGATF